jgi:hypothetical protein
MLSVLQDCRNMQEERKRERERESYNAASGVGAMWGVSIQVLAAGTCEILTCPLL